MNKNILVFVIVGAAAGLVLAQYYPDLGLAKGERFAAGLGRAFGADKPFVRNALIGAVAGALLGLFGKK